MSYAGQGDLAQDQDFRDRLAACAATQGIQQAAKWAVDNSWLLSASPGFADAYSYALEVGTEKNPGRSQAVIPDLDILAAVQAQLRPSP